MVSLGGGGIVLEQENPSVSSIFQPYTAMAGKSDDLIH